MRCLYRVWRHVFGLTCAELEGSELHTFVHVLAGKAETEEQAYKHATKDCDWQADQAPYGKSWSRNDEPPSYHNGEHWPCKDPGRLWQKDRVPEATSRLAPSSGSNIPTSR